MRPHDTRLSGAFECFDCGRRFESPASRSCPACGGELSNLAVGRDF